MGGSAKHSGWACVCALMVVASGCSVAAAAGLPDGRAYELVSPPVKHGADVASDSRRTRAAADGSAVSFVSLGGFGDVAGMGQATEYISERSRDPDPGANGWATHGITPKQDPLTIFAVARGLDASWQGEFSADLSRGVFGTLSPLTGEDPNVVNVFNLYRRADLRTAGVGSYRLLTPCPACSVPFAPNNVLRAPGFAGASANFSHVIFESALPLTPDAITGPGIVHVYEWVDGTLRLVDMLPESACGSPPCHAVSSAAGAGARLAPPRVISADGSRINFTDTSTGDHQSAGTLYERINGSQTVQINVSEKTTPDAPQPATYQTASVDGRRVFFTTAEQMTDDDTNGVPDLYMWDATGAPGHHLMLLSVDSHASDGADLVQGVMGASDDGSYVYFIAQGQLVAGKPALALNGFYVWHEGAVPAVSYIGASANGNDTLTDVVAHIALGGGPRVRVTPDGRHIVFAAHSGDGLLSAHGGVDVDQTQCNDHACRELYVYSADTDSLVCASCNPNGTPPTTGADTFVRNGGTFVTASHVTHSLSADGQWFFFHTEAGLVSQDTNGKSDVYEYDVQTGALSLISSGHDPADSYFMDASTDGRDVFFLTRQRLVGWDTDANYDLYDARVGGGFPEPAAPPPSCSGDACKGPVGMVPNAASAGSALLGGDGNVKTTAPKPKAKAKRAKGCRRGFVRRRRRSKVSCVKKHGPRTRRSTAQRRAR